MIVDCHTHLANAEHIGGEFLAGAQRAWGGECSLEATPQMHKEACKECDAAIVLPIDAEEISGFSMFNSTNYNSGRTGVGTPTMKNMSVGIQLNF